MWVPAGTVISVMSVSYTHLDVYKRQVLLLRQGVTRWSSVAYLIVFWAVLAYLALPRVHRILSLIHI